MTEAPDEVRRFSCNRCQRETKHFVRGKHLVTEEDVEFGVSTTQEALIIECCGCEHLAFVKRVHFSEHILYDQHPVTGELRRTAHWEEVIYPPVSYRAAPPWFEDLPDPTLREISQEIYKSLQTDSLYLATFGSRTLMDRLIVLLVGDKKTFANGLTALLDKGMISHHEQDILRPIIQAGHAAAHRGWAPTREQFKTILDTIEGLIHRLLVLPKLAEELDEAVPGRKPGGEVKTRATLTIEAKIEASPNTVRGLYETLAERLRGLGKDVTVHPQKHYMAFRRNRNFACVEVFNRKKLVRAYLNVDPDEVDLTRSGVRDVRQIGHFGTGDLGSGPIKLLANGPIA